MKLDISREDEGVLYYSILEAMTKPDRPKGYKDSLIRLEVAIAKALKINNQQ